MPLRSPAPMFILLALLLACSPDTPHPATGTIEATQTDLGTDVAARVALLRVKEGDLVSAGDTLAILTTVTLDADVARQEATVADASAQLADLRAGARPEELQRARSELQRAEAELALAESTRRRIEPLAANGDVAAQQGDEAKAAAAQSSARAAAARQALRLLEAGTRPGAISAAQARVEQARAGLAASNARQRDLVLVAPVRARVRGAWFETGELVPAGRPVLTLADDTTPWVRVYVGQKEFARIAPGMKATVTLDVGGPAIPARVISTSDHAEFTPRVALTEAERADLTFWVKLQLTDTTGRAKAGLPATVHFDFPATPR